MQQAYLAIRVISEAQTVRIVLSTHPDEAMLDELRAACASLSGSGSMGIKAVVLDFADAAQETAKGHESASSSHAEGAYNAILAVAQPVLIVARDTLSPIACGLLAAADFALVSSNAILTLNTAKHNEGGQEVEEKEMMRGEHAARLGYITWTASPGDLNREMERILKLLREKSATALRLAKAAARLGQAERARQTPPLDALRLVNALYLTEVMRTQDATEGLGAFLEKRKPVWKDR